MSQSNDELREFLLVVRRALLMICSYIERRYVAVDERRSDQIAVK